MSFWSVLNPASWISEVVTTIAAPFTEWQKRKTLNAETENKISILNAEASVKRAEAAIEAAKQGQQIQADWDTNAQEQMKFTWKDEFIMLIFLSPFVCSFIPTLQVYIKEGFAFLERSTPWWYILIVLGIVASTFGLRWLIAPIVQKKLEKK